MKIVCANIERADRISKTDSQNINFNSANVISSINRALNKCAEIERKVKQFLKNMQKNTRTKHEAVKVQRFLRETLFTRKLSKRTVITKTSETP